MSVERSLGQYNILTKGVAHDGEAKITAESLVKVDVWELNKIWDVFPCWGPWHCDLSFNEPRFWGFKNQMPTTRLCSGTLSQKFFFEEDFVNCKIPVQKQPFLWRWCRFLLPTFLSFGTKSRYISQDTAFCADLGCAIHRFGDRSSNTLSWFKVLICLVNGWFWKLVSAHLLKQPHFTQVVLELLDTVDAWSLVWQSEHHIWLSNCSKAHGVLLETLVLRPGLPIVYLFWQSWLAQQWVSVSVGTSSFEVSAFAQIATRCMRHK